MSLGSIAANISCADIVGLDAGDDDDIRCRIRESGSVAWAE